MSLVVTGHKKLVEILATVEKPIVQVLDNHALRLVRFSSEFFNGVRTSTNYENDLKALDNYNVKRQKIIEEWTAEGKTQDEINEEIGGPATVPNPETYQGMYFTIQGVTKYLVTHESGIWLAYSTGKILYLAPILSADVKDSMFDSAILVPSKTFCLMVSSQV